MGTSIDLDGIGYLSNLERLIIDSKDVKGIEYLKGLANLKEVIFLHIHKEQKQAIESYGIKVNHTEEDIYPAFISEIGNFKLSSGMKSDASDIFKALNLIWAIITCVLILIFIFNDKALRPIWEPLTMIGLGYLFMPVTFGLWFYFLDFELQMTKDQLIIQRVWGVQKLDINAIETATFKEPNMKVSTIKIKTHKKTYRLVNSVFASPKSIRVFKKRLEEKGIKIINK